MILNILFFLLIIAICIARVKGYCGNCDGETVTDIIQIIVFASGATIFIGIATLFKLAVVLIVSLLVRVIAKKLFKKPIAYLNKKCKSCTDPWQKENIGGNE